MSDKALSLKEFIEEINKHKDSFNNWENYFCSFPGQASIDIVIVDSNGNEDYGEIIGVSEDLKMGCACVCGLTIRARKHD